MDPLMQFLSWQFVLFALAVAAATYVLRVVLDYFIKLPAQKIIWENLILPLFPIFLGGILGGLVSKYPYPGDLHLSVGGRIIFGVVAGMLSTILYRVIKSLLNAKTSIAASNTDSPGADMIETIRNSIKD